MTEAKKYQSRDCSKLNYRVVPIIDSNLLLLYINDACNEPESCKCQDPTDGVSN